MRKTMRQKLIAILVGPGAMCRMSYEDAGALLNELCETLKEMSPEIREAAEAAISKNNRRVTQDNIANFYWRAAVAEIQE